MILEASGLRQRYGAREVVGGVDLAVAPGQIAGLLGKNGAGKTTIFALLAGITRGEGRVSLDGEDVTRLPLYARARRGLGFLPQEASIFRRLSVQDNLRVALEPRGAVAELPALLERFELRSLSSAFGDELSGGERRRVEIARAFAARPKVLLCDEPFAGLDPIAKREIDAILRELAREGVALLLTDHDARAILSLANVVSLLEAGRVVARGSPEELVRDARARQVYLGADFSL